MAPMDPLLNRPSGNQPEPPRRPSPAPRRPAPEARPVQPRRQPVARPRPQAADGAGRQGPPRRPPTGGGGGGFGGTPPGPRRPPGAGRTPGQNRLPALAAIGVLAVVGIAAFSGGEDAPSSATPPAGDRGGISESMTVPSTTAPIVVDTVPAIEKSQLAAAVTIGSGGEDVRKVQQRLKDLGFEPGPIDGAYGETTQQAVWAYKKLILRMTPQELEDSDNASQISPDMWLAMQDDISIPPRRPQGGGQHMEIYLPEQVAIVFHADVPVLITHISSGDLDENGQPVEFCEIGKFDTDDKGNVVDPPVEKAICAKAKTPGGIFQFYREFEGNRVSALGGMKNPAYFNYGIAVHGAFEVPLHPASHGCVRVNHYISDFFLDLVGRGDLVFVWGHDGKEPEHYTKSERLPSFNYADPNATTTTSSTTTTVAPTTTKPATTTTKPPATTTTVAPTTTTSTTVPTT